MTVLNLQVGASNGDSEHVSGTNDAGRAVTVSGTCTITNTVLSPGSHNNNNEWTIAARFTNVTVPNAATINSATFVLKAQGSYDASPNVVSFHVSAQAADNAGALTTNNGDLNVTARPRSTADAGEWVQTSVTAETDYSRSCTSIIQETVNRAGWVSGNALVILIDTHANTSVGEWQDYYSYDNTASKAPKLDIDYADAGGQPAIIRTQGVPTGRGISDRPRRWN
jgi:hypothetical protein